MSNKDTYSDELEKLIKKEIKLGELKGIIYTNGRKKDMLQIDIDNKIFRMFNTVDEKVEIEEYFITKLNIYYIKALIKKYNYPAWTNLPMGDLLALDAPDRKLVFEYDNTKVDGNNNVEYSINLYSRIPKDGYKCIDILLDYILSLRKRKKLIKETEE